MLGGASKREVLGPTAGTASMEKRVSGDNLPSREASSGWELAGSYLLGHHLRVH